MARFSNSVLAATHPCNTQMSCTGCSQRRRRFVTAEEITERKNDTYLMRLKADLSRDRLSFRENEGPATFRIPWPSHAVGCNRVQY